MKIIKYSDAKINGLKYYYTGIKCFRGHLAKRYTKSRYCSLCMSVRNKTRKHKKQSIIINKQKIITFNNDYNKKCSIKIELILSYTGIKSDDLIKNLGYSNNELHKHLESMFVQGMEHDNYGKWYISRIKSINDFFVNGIYSGIKINGLVNLYPKWSQIRRPIANKSNVYKGCLNGYSKMQRT